jgi:hypothetical protein
MLPLSLRFSFVRIVAAVSVGTRFQLLPECPGAVSLWRTSFSSARIGAHPSPLPPRRTDRQPDHHQIGDDDRRGLEQDPIPKPQRRRPRLHQPQRLWSPAEIGAGKDHRCDPTNPTSHVVPPTLVPGSPLPNHQSSVANRRRHKSHPASRRGPFPSRRNWVPDQSRPLPSTLSHFSAARTLPGKSRTSQIGADNPRSFYLFDLLLRAVLPANLPPPPKMIPNHATWPSQSKGARPSSSTQRESEVGAISPVREVAH